MSETTKDATARDVFVVMTSVGSEEEAERIAGALVEERLAACCQTFPISSTYRWKGEICRDTEFLLLAKTANAAAAVERVKQQHSYEIPEILVIPVIGGHDPYLEWVRGSSS